MPYIVRLQGLHPFGSWTNTSLHPFTHPTPTYSSRPKSNATSSLKPSWIPHQKRCLLPHILKALCLDELMSGRIMLGFAPHVSESPAHPAVTRGQTPSLGHSPPAFSGWPLAAQMTRLPRSLPESPGGSFFWSLPLHPVFPFMQHSL